MEEENKEADAGNQMGKENMKGIDRKAFLKNEIERNAKRGKNREGP